MGDYLMSLIKANDITNVTGGIPTVKSQQLIPTAWVNFNGMNTVAIRDSEGVSSITDNGVGLYRVNFAVAMANTNYVALVSGQGGNESQPDSWSTAWVLVNNRSVSNTGQDATNFGVAILGGQS